MLYFFCLSLIGSFFDTPELACCPRAECRRVLSNTVGPPICVRRDVEAWKAGPNVKAGINGHILVRDLPMSLYQTAGRIYAEKLLGGTIAASQRQGSKHAKYGGACGLLEISSFPQSQ